MVPVMTEKPSAVIERYFWHGWSVHGSAAAQELWQRLRRDGKISTGVLLNPSFGYLWPSARIINYVWDLSQNPRCAWFFLTLPPLETKIESVFKSFGFFM